MNFEKCHECVRVRLLAGIVQNRRGVYVCIFLSDLIFYVPSTIFQLNRDGSSWVEPVLS